MACTPTSLGQPFCIPLALPVSGFGFVLSPPSCFASFAEFDPLLRSYLSFNRSAFRQPNGAILQQHGPSREYVKWIGLFPTGFSLRERGLEF